MMKNNWKEKAGDAIIFFICCAITLFISLLFGLGTASFGFVGEYCIAFGIVETIKVFLTGWKYRIILFFANVCLAYYLSSVFHCIKWGEDLKNIVLAVRLSIYLLLLGLSIFSTLLGYTVLIIRSFKMKGKV